MLGRGVLIGDDLIEQGEQLAIQRTLLILIRTHLDTLAECGRCLVGRHTRLQTHT